MKLCILGSFLWLDSFIGATWLWFRNIGLVYWLSSSPRQHHHTTITTTTSFTTHFTTTLDSAPNCQLTQMGFLKRKKLNYFRQYHYAQIMNLLEKLLKLSKFCKNFALGFRTSNVLFSIWKWSILENSFWCQNPKDLWYTLSSWFMLYFSAGCGAWILYGHVTWLMWY